MTTTTKPVARVETKLSREKLLGPVRRWRRKQAPVPAGDAARDDGTTDYGLFGPGSVAWEILLHPATIVLETTAQGTFQLLYGPIAAGIRDVDPISRKGRAGTLTFFDSFERFQRNSGMHAPMWLGDTETAQTMAAHLHRFHGHVKGEVIDRTNPEIGGYAAAEPRDAMWAALTEIYPIMLAFEAFAFRDGRLPHRLTDAQRDQFIDECAGYLRLVGADEAEIPHSMADLEALFATYDHLFRPPELTNLLPDSGEDYQQIMAEAMIKNFHISQVRAIIPLLTLHVLWELPIMGAFGRDARRWAGYSPAKSALAVAAKKLALPVAWLVQQPLIEKRVMRLMWGPDGVELIQHARELHAQAKAARERERA